MKYLAQVTYGLALLLSVGAFGITLDFASVWVGVTLYFGTDFISHCWRSYKIGQR